MARENQGLQIALIIFVMLTIILGVTTYLCFRLYNDADNRAKMNLEEREKSARLAVKNEEDVNELKRLIFGVAKADKVETITAETFSADMAKLGGAYPEEARFYRPLVEKMSGTINEKNAELAETKNKIAKLEEDFRVREAGKQPQLDSFQKAADAAAKDLDGERAKFKTERDRITQDQSRLKSDLEAARKEGAANLAQIEDKLQKANTRETKLVGINRNLSQTLEKVTSQDFEVAQGEIRWINQRSGLAWINLGRADSLQRQISFSVYPADSSDVKVNSKKGSVEVTQILGDHLAEVRVYDDAVGNPIVPGDKLFTPIWAPGEKRHFALAGFVDLDSDDRSDMETVRQLIEMNGGVVDSYVDDKGKKIGEVTINTRYLVLGQKPNEKSAAGTLDAFSRMETEAGNLGVQKIQLSDLLQQMGWKDQSPVTHYGRGANLKDFGAKNEGLPKKSTGSVSDVFKPRVPPARIPTSAY